MQCRRSAAGFGVGARDDAVRGFVRSGVTRRECLGDNIHFNTMADTHTMRERGKDVAQDTDAGHDTTHPYKLHVAGGVDPLLAVLALLDFSAWRFEGGGGFHGF